MSVGNSKLTFPLGQVIKGQVTKVNTLMLYFEVEETFRVYLDLTNTPACLPCLHSNIEIINPRKFSSSTYTAIIGPETIYQCPTDCPDFDTTNKFIEFLKANNIDSDVDELIAIDLIVRKLEPFVKKQCIQLLCIQILYKYAPYATNLGDINDSKKSFRKLQPRIPKDLHYANCNSEQYSFLNLEGQYMFNVYPNRRVEKVTDCVSEFLFGILAVSESNGYFILQDDRTEIFVKFTLPSKDLYKFDNCLVLIKKYVAFNEIYKVNTRPTLHYILLNVKDVIIVMADFQSKKTKLFHGINEPLAADLKYSYFLQTGKISEVIYGYNNSPECWVEALISPQESFIQSERVYAIMPKELLRIIPFLKEHIMYKIFTGQRLKYGNIALFRELYGMKEIKKVLLLSCDSIFQETYIQPVGTFSKVLEDFQEIKSHIASTSDYKTFSFILNIEKKIFQHTTFTSWFPKRHTNVTPFGDLENYQQRLIFRDEQTNFFIDLYLTNRENHVIPLGLISNVTVKVKHVQVNKKKYLKATVFTGFDIVDYCPKIMFSSVNLSFDDKSTWQWRAKTSPTLLGMYEHIPSNCVVHGTVLFRAVLDLHLSVICVKCRQVALSEHCDNCKSKERNVNVFIVIQVQDAISPTFYMEVDNVYFLLELLGLRNEKGVDAFFEECFEGKMQMEIDFLKVSEDHLINNADSNLILQKIVTMIRSQINYKFYFMMDVVCVRQIGDRRKPWKLIDFEFLH